MKKVNLILYITIYLLSINLFNLGNTLIENHNYTPSVSSRIYLQDINEEPILLEKLINEFVVDYPDETEIYIVSDEYSGMELEVGDYKVVIAATNLDGLTSYFTLIIMVVEL